MRRSADRMPFPHRPITRVDSRETDGAVHGKLQVMMQPCWKVEAEVLAAQLSEVNLYAEQRRTSSDRCGSLDRRRLKRNRSRDARRCHDLCKRRQSSD